MVAHPLSLHFQCIAAAWHPLGPRFSPVLCYSYLTRAALGFRSLLYPYHHEPLCSCSPLTDKRNLPVLESHPVSFRAEDKGNCPKSGGFGQENPHSRGAANHELRNWVATGV